MNQENSTSITLSPDLLDKESRIRHFAHYNNIMDDYSVKSDALTGICFVVYRLQASLGCLCERASATASSSLDGHTDDPVLERYLVDFVANLYRLADRLLDNMALSSTIKEQPPTNAKTPHSRFQLVNHLTWSLLNSLYPYDMCSHAASSINEADEMKVHYEVRKAEQHYTIGVVLQETLALAQRIGITLDKLYSAVYDHLVDHANESYAMLAALYTIHDERRYVKGTELDEEARKVQMKDLSDLLALNANTIDLSYWPASSVCCNNKER